ncbi:protein fam63a-like [Moniliophthora roreri MCA 2997]|uniref:Protein fam63a-like n=1 Tax=Moniliophthora roreri (strain MCA 2997) TaxID=1381753 RepID=V2WWS9_MONRO|nr:protein fam63a-like [Moniliophthora roreri MCA 2997]
MADFQQGSSSSSSTQLAPVASSSSSPRPSEIQPTISRSQSDQRSLQSSEAEVWYLKDIEFGEGNAKKWVKIITQNYNGPCSFIAICNILILRGKIEIQPPMRRTVSYEFLSHLVAEYLLLNCPEVDVSAALSILPYTQKGMDLNPLFTGCKSFRPEGHGGELMLFQQVGIDLVHGWIVDPNTDEAKVLSKSYAEDYDSAVVLIAEVDHLTKGQLVVHDTDIPQGAQVEGTGSSKAPSKWTEEEREKIDDAIVVRQFLDNTKSQMTYYGLFNLATVIKPGSLVALYRNLHLSVLYKRPVEDDSSLYQLVSDHVFLNEPSIVWERLEDVDGGWSTFVDSSFIKSSPAGGDFAGQTAEEALRAAEMGNFVVSEPGDADLARQLQAEEDDRARGERAAYLQERNRRRLAEEERQRKKKGKRKDCIIM